MIRMVDLGKMAGLLEGEGCFGSSGRRAAPPTCPRIQFSSTDRDVAEWVARMLKTKIYGAYPNNHGVGGKRAKPLYKVCANVQTSAEWMMTIYPLMGQRRQARIRELLAAWRTTRPGRPRKDGQ